jgi:Rrf2 family protein
MDRWLAISDGANAALHALAFAARSDKPSSARTAAEAIGVSPSYLAKLVQELARAGLAEMSRGAAGGFNVSGDPASISALDVILAIDGAEPARQCLFPEAVCASKACVLRSLCAELAEKSRTVLAATSVADLSRNF